MALPDYLVHSWVGKERLIQFIVAPLAVANEIQDYIFPKLPLILYSQPRGPQDLLSIVTIYMDHSTVDHFT